MKSNSVAISVLLAAVMSAGVAGCKERQVVAPTSSNQQDPVVRSDPPRTTVGTALDDSVVTTKVKSALVADPDVKGFDIQVETRKGEVQLSGFVESPAQVDRALTVARGVAGVTRVENHMTVKSASATAGTTVDDTIVTTKVKTALLADKSIKSTDISVVTNRGLVQLSGYVDSPSQIDRAVEVARTVEGVKSVDNKMSVKK